jgi:hypothetical protein
MNLNIGSRDLAASKVNGDAFNDLGSISGRDTNYFISHRVLWFPQAPERRIRKNFPCGLSKQSLKLIGHLFADVKSA